MDRFVTLLGRIAEHYRPACVSLSFLMDLLYSF